MIEHPELGSPELGSPELGSPELGTPELGDISASTVSTRSGYDLSTCFGWRHVCRVTVGPGGRRNDFTLKRCFRGGLRFGCRLIG